MSKAEDDETLALWNRIAHDWDRQVGADGDANRRLNSDPVLWRFAGNVAGLRVLDAGCGTGYLSRQLAVRGAHVVGIDFAPAMIDIARSKSPDIDFRVASCADLASLDGASFDLIVSNYVLMDTPDLHGALHAFHRVLKPAGRAVLVFSHPCFPSGRARVAGPAVEYRWNFSYFEHRKCTDPPWGHFTADFIWFHRPLSDYWKAFTAARFDIRQFEEPHDGEARHAENSTQINSGQDSRWPYSVAFELRKRAG